MTNIGIGAKAEEVKLGKQARLACLISGVIGKGRFLQQTSTEMAVSSEGKADMMGIYEDLSMNDIMYERSMPIRECLTSKWMSKVGGQ